MENEEIKKVCVDSCVYEEVILGQHLSDKCEDEINDLHNKKHKICLTPIIYYEVIKRIHEELNREFDDKKYSSIAFAGKNRRIAYERYLFAFSKLSKNSETISIIGDNFQEIMDKCTEQLRVEINDKINLAIAIINGCDEFITKDRKIFEENQTIERISRGKMNIYYQK